MKKNNTLLALLTIFFPIVLSGQYYDQNWPVGILEYPGNSQYGNAIIHFDGNNTTVTKQDLKMNFERTVAAMSDSSGALLFYSNGCYIATANGDTMQNGDGINPGTVHDWICPENGYNVQRGALVLPYPGQPSQYIMFHLGARYNPNDGISTGPFYYSMIDMANGAGMVISKNTVLLDNKPESFTAIRHGNGRDWWVICAEYGSNRYFRYLLSPNGVSLVGTPITTGPIADCSRTGTLTVSLDGSKLARTQNCRTVVLDFDRCTGTLAFSVAFERSPNSFAGGGAVFSKDGQRLLLSEHMAILQADLSTSNPTMDTVVPFDSLIGRGLQIMERTPNGDLYFSLPHRGRAMPVLKGFDDNVISFNKTGILLPVYSVRSLPFFPNYQLLDAAGTACDTLGIDTPVSSQELISNPQYISLYPNPSTGIFALEWTGQTEDICQIRVTDALGRIVLSHKWTGGRITLDISKHPPGAYWVQVKDEKGLFRFSKTLIKQDKNN
jgi:hypothetical protein